MRRRRGLLALLAAVSVEPACVTMREQPSVFGRPVTVVSQPDGSKLKGELLAINEDRLWIRTQTEVLDLPLQSIRRVYVQRHSLNGSRAMNWAITAAVTTGVALSVACASVEGNSGSGCAVVGLVVGGIQLGAGALSARSLESSSRIQVEPPRPVDLRAFARFPQGLPEGVDPAALQGKPPKEK